MQILKFFFETQSRADQKGRMSKLKEKKIKMASNTQNNKCRRVGTSSKARKKEESKSCVLRFLL